jgi:hypothetical protein
MRIVIAKAEDSLASIANYAEPRFGAKKLMLIRLTGIILMIKNPKGDGITTRVFQLASSNVWYNPLVITACLSQKVRRNQYERSTSSVTTALPNWLTIGMSQRVISGRF